MKFKCIDKIVQEKFELSTKKEILQEIKSRVQLYNDELLFVNKIIYYSIGNTYYIVEKK